MSRAAACPPILLALVLASAWMPIQASEGSGGDEAHFGLSLYYDKLEGVGGAWVTGTSPGGPAERAGLRPGDFVLEINGEGLEFHGMIDFLGYLRTLEAGQRVRFTVLRGGVRQEAILVGESISPKARQALDEWIEEARRRVLEGESILSCEAEQALFNMRRNAKRSKNNNPVWRRFLHGVKGRVTLTITKNPSDEVTVASEDDVGVPLHLLKDNLPADVAELAGVLKRGDSFKLEISYDEDLRTWKIVPVDLADDLRDYMSSRARQSSSRQRGQN